MKKFNDFDKYFEIYTGKLKTVLNSLIKKNFSISRIVNQNNKSE